LNYLLRPQSQQFDNISWFSYLKGFEVVRRRSLHKQVAETESDDDKVTRSQNHCSSSFLLSPSHPQYGSKAVAVREKPVVVRIVGPGMRPSVRRDSDEKDDEFSKQVLLLFLPHRTIDELKRGKPSWIESLKDAYASNKICDAGIRFVRNNEDRWECILRSQELAASFKESLLELDAKVSVEEASNNSSGAGSTDAVLTQQLDDAASEEEGFWSSDDENEEQLYCEDNDLVDPNEATLPSSTNADLLFVDEFHMPEDFIANKLKNPELTKKLMASTIPTLFTGYKATKKTEIPYFTHSNALEEGLKPLRVAEDEMDSEDDEDEKNCNPVENPLKVVQRAPRLMQVKEVQNFQQLVEYAVAWPQTETLKGLFESTRNAWLESVIEDSPDTKPTCLVTIEIDEAQKEIPHFASIAEISKACSLLEDQHRAFFIMGSALLRSFARDEVDIVCAEHVCPIASLSSATDLEEQQALLLIHGVGGSGKSVIVRAITALATSWMREKAIITASIAGVACVNISGYTVASLMYKRRPFFDQVRPHPIRNRSYSHSI
jgi:hypothetical protein